MLPGCARQLEVASHWRAPSLSVVVKVCWLQFFGFETRLGPLSFPQPSNGHGAVFRASCARLHRLARVRVGQPCTLSEQGGLGLRVCSVISSNRNMNMWLTSTG